MSTPAAPPTVSLILCTVRRTDEVARFLDSLSLDDQGEPDWEVIIVDQNPDERLVPIIARSSSRFPVIHLRSEPGLSRARNVGLRAVRGTIVGFPDDDCWYPPGLLPRIRAFFAEHPEWDGLTGMCVGDSGEALLSGASRTAQPVRRLRVWRQAISYTIFLRVAALDGVGGFDERLGVGAETPWGSGEESDLVLRLLETGRRLYHDPSFRVGHPSPSGTVTAESRARARAYGRGMGWVLHERGLPRWFVAYQILRAPMGALLCLLRGERGRALLYLDAMRGRMDGYRRRPR